MSLTDQWRDYARVIFPDTEEIEDVIARMLANGRVEHPGLSDADVLARKFLQARPPSPKKERGMSPLEARLAAIEKRLDALEGRPASVPAGQAQAEAYLQEVAAETGKSIEQVRRELFAEFEQLVVAVSGSLATAAQRQRHEFLQPIFYALRPL